jgi:hypothetical protein
VGASLSRRVATGADGEASKREGANPELYAGASEYADQVLLGNRGDGTPRSCERGRGGGFSVAVVDSN